MYLWHEWIIIIKVGGSMKRFKKFLLGFCVFVILIIGLLFLIFSLGGKRSFFAGVLINIELIALLGISLFGIFKGKIRFLRVKSRIGAFGVFFVSVIMIAYVSGLVIANTIITEMKAKGENPSIKEKVLLATNMLVPIGYQWDLETVELEGITIRTPKGENETINKIKNFYPKAKEEVDKIFGDNYSEHFTVIIYDNPHTFKRSARWTDIGAFYDPINQSVHLQSPAIYNFDFKGTFYHEYTHYRFDTFLKQNDIPRTKIPTWFNEGISEYIGNLDTYVDIDLVEEVDFTDLDKNHNYHQENIGNKSPYLQSYFAVRSLVQEHGIDVIPELLLSSKEKPFYDGFQEVTGKSIEEFQVSFMELRKKEKELWAQVDEAHKKHDFEKEETLLMEIIHLDKDSIHAYDSLVYIYIKQSRFDKAIETINESMSKKDKIQVADLHILSELYLMSNPKEALIYAEKAEQLVKEYNGTSTGGHSTKYADAVRLVNSDDPVAGYALLFNNGLINYKEIRQETYKQLLKQYPDDSRIINLKN
jgi:tetratricopeptide (TPR) repeat protein